MLLVQLNFAIFLTAFCTYLLEIYPDCEFRLNHFSIKVLLQVGNSNFAMLSFFFFNGESRFHQDSTRMR